MWFVEGLESGRFALVAKIHHSLVDGVSGIGVLTAAIVMEMVGFLLIRKISNVKL